MTPVKADKLVSLLNEAASIGATQVEVVWVPMPNGVQKKTVFNIPEEAFDIADMVRNKDKYEIESISFLPNNNQMTTSEKIKNRTIIYADLQDQDLKDLFENVAILTDNFTDFSDPDGQTLFNTLVDEVEREMLAVSGQSSVASEMPIDLKVGDTFYDSFEIHEPKRRIIKIKDGNVYHVSVDAKDELYPNFESLSQLRETINRQDLYESERHERQQKLKEEERKEAVDIAEFNDIDGFADNVSPVEKGRILAYLNSKKNGIKVKDRIRDIANNNGIISSLFQSKISTEYLDYLKSFKTTLKTDIQDLKESVNALAEKIEAKN